MKSRFLSVTFLAVTSLLALTFFSCDTLLNTSPVADAGSDQEVTLGTEVLLDGSDSADVNGDALSFVWSLNSYPSLSGLRSDDITGANNTIAQVTPDVVGVFIFGIVSKICGQVLAREACQVHDTRQFAWRRRF
jgi:hypothetical protein